jgi:hypothetical protein
MTTLDCIAPRANIRVPNPLPNNPSESRQCRMGWRRRSELVQPCCWPPCPPGVSVPRWPCGVGLWRRGGSQCLMRCEPLRWICVGNTISRVDPGVQTLYIRVRGKTGAALMGWFQRASICQCGQDQQPSLPPSARQSIAGQTTHTACHRSRDRRIIVAIPRPSPAGPAENPFAG